VSFSDYLRRITRPLSDAELDAAERAAVGEPRENFSADASLLDSINVHADLNPANVLSVAKEISVLSIDLDTAANAVNRTVVVYALKAAETGRLTTDAARIARESTEQVEEISQLRSRIDTEFKVIQWTLTDPANGTPDKPRRFSFVLVKLAEPAEREAALAAKLVERCEAMRGSLWSQFADSSILEEVRNLAKKADQLKQSASKLRTA